MTSLSSLKKYLCHHMSAHPIVLSRDIADSFLYFMRSYSIFSTPTKRFSGLSGNVRLLLTLFSGPPKHKLCMHKTADKGNGILNVKSPLNTARSGNHAGYCTTRNTRKNTRSFSQKPFLGVSFGTRNLEA